QPAGRLHKALVETGKASSVFGQFFSLAEPGIFFAGAELRKEQSLPEVRSILLQTLDGIGGAKVSPAEVERARTNIDKRITLAMNQAEVLGLQLSEFIAKGDWRLFFLHRDRIRKVTADDVNRVAAAYLRPVNRTIGEYLPVDKNPARADVPEAPKVAGLPQGSTGEKASDQGEAFDP